jgi:hypothetical protein
MMPEAPRSSYLPLKLIGYGLMMVICSTLYFWVSYQRPLDGFLLGLGIFLFGWKTGAL